jgi:hypothetical protein
VAAWVAEATPRLSALAPAALAASAAPAASEDAMASAGDSRVAVAGVVGSEVVVTVASVAAAVAVLAAAAIVALASKTVTVPLRMHLQDLASAAVIGTITGTGNETAMVRPVGMTVVAAHLMTGLVDALVDATVDATMDATVDATVDATAAVSETATGEAATPTTSPYAAAGTETLTDPGTATTGMTTENVASKEAMKTLGSCAAISWCWFWWVSSARTSTNLGSLPYLGACPGTHLSFWSPSLCSLGATKGKKSALATPDGLDPSSMPSLPQDKQVNVCQEYLFPAYVP